MELLVPVGSMDCLKAAVLNGADAVYLGLKDFSARKFARNFSIFELKKAIEICHGYDIKVYLAMNILVKNNEIKRFFLNLKEAYQLGIDAVIIQDLGLINLIKKNFPDLKIHLSTQNSVFNSLSVRDNVERIILPRELGYENIKNLKINKELEIFVHGAICVSVSGQCLLSSFLGGRSGNRGACAQPCRKRYNNEYFLSTKDLCLIEKIPELIKIGITALKIEGRMRRPFYVAIVTRLYKTAIEYAGSGKVFKLSQEALNKLKLAYNREFCCGKIFDDFIFARDFSSHRGLLAGKKNFSLSFDFERNEEVVVKESGILKTVILKKDYKKNDILLDFDEIYKLKVDYFSRPLKKVSKVKYKRINKELFLPRFSSIKNNDKIRFFVRVYNKKDAFLAYEYGADVIYVDVFNLDLDEIKKRIGDKLFLYIPRIIYDKDIKIIQKIIRRIQPKGLLVGNPAFLNEKLEIHLDYNFNVFNDIDLIYYKNYLAIISPELSIKELAFFSNKRFICLLHGKIILMTFAHNFQEAVLRDERGFFRINGIYNGSELINGREIAQLNLIMKLINEGIKYFYLDLEKNIEIIKIYRAIINGENVNMTIYKKNATVAWFFNGVD